MIIAFTGAQGVGKSTLIKALKPDLETLIPCKFVNSIARKARSKGIGINMESDFEDQIFILDSFLKKYFKGVKNLD